MLDLPSDHKDMWILTHGLDQINMQIADIAHELNAYGGYKLMQETYDMNSHANLETTFMDSAWDGIGQWASRDETIRDRITNLQQELLEHTVKLKKFSIELQFELHNDTKWAHEKMNKSITDVSERYKQIGEKLNIYGGFDLMQISIYKVSKAGYSITAIEHAWHGIGEWLV